MRARTTPPSLSAVLLLAGAASGQSTDRINVDPVGGQADDVSAYPAISADGRFAAFASAATNLVANDTNGVPDVFVRDLAAGTTVRASVSSAGAQADGASFTPALSADGRYVAFASGATNLAGVDANGTQYDVFVRDLVAGVTERVSVTPSGAGGDDSSFSVDFSADGRFVMFSSYASDLVAGDGAGSLDLFVRDRMTGTTDGVTVGGGGLGQALGIQQATISGDGRFVAYRGLFAGVPTVVLRDRLFGTSVPVATDAGGPVNAESPRIAADGSAVAFMTAFDLLPVDDRFNQQDVYVYDVATQQLSFASAGLSGGAAASSSFLSSISADGRSVLFTSVAPDLVPDDTNGAFDGFLHDRLTGKTVRVTVGDAGQEGLGASGSAVVSADGRTVVFSSDAANLVPGDTNGVTDVFVRELCAPASSTTYGAGFPGTGGVVPTLTLGAPPRLGFAPSLLLSNSAGVATPAVLLVGLQPQSLPTSALGTLLVDPLWALPDVVPAAGASYTVAIPNDPTLCGVPLYLQAIEQDAGAAAGLSFTAGLEVDIGS